MKTPYKCQGSTFDPKMGKCSSLYTCPCSLTTTKITTLLTEAPPVGCQATNKTFECKKTGRFPDLSDGSCKSYFLCILLENGTISKTPYNCPGSSTFDPQLQTCSIEYVCPCEFTTISTKPPNECEISNKTFECEKVGRFPDLSDLNCKKYFLCTLLRNGTILKYPYKCQGASAFDSKLQKCSSEYTCPCSTPPETTTVLPTTPGCTIPTSNFECKVDGRFPNLFDTTCTKYYLCTKLRNGTFIKTPYTCQKSSFNPLLGKCSSKFLCPCGSTPTTTPTIPTTTEGFTTAPLITTTNAYNCENSPTRVILPFDCSTKGRFPDFSDNSCRRYFLCSQLRNGTFLKTPYRCPVSSCINSEMQKCSSECICPCSYLNIEM